MPGSPCLPCGKTHVVCDSCKMEPPRDTRSYSPLKAFTAYKRRTLIDLACLRWALGGPHRGPTSDSVTSANPPRRTAQCSQNDSNRTTNCAVARPVPMVQYSWKARGPEIISGTLVFTNARCLHPMPPYPMSSCSHGPWPALTPKCFPPCMWHCLISFLKRRTSRCDFKIRWTSQMLQAHTNHNLKLARDSSLSSKVKPPQALVKHSG